MNSPKTSSQSIGSWLSPRKRAFITGTLLLTGTGFLCRVLGFFYRIFMSRAVGAEGLGIYNMVHPVFGICFAVCAGSIQTALSQYVAANMKRGRAAFRSGLIISMSLSVLLAAFICRFDDFLAARLQIINLILQFGLSGFQCLFQFFQPVSYTHLDVYKRQAPK